jgi:hypothetical protein
MDGPSHVTSSLQCSAQLAVRFQLPQRGLCGLTLASAIGAPPDEMPSGGAHFPNPASVAVACATRSWIFHWVCCAACPHSREYVVWKGLQGICLYAGLGCVHSGARRRSGSRQDNLGLTVVLSFYSCSFLVSLFLFPLISFQFYFLPLFFFTLFWCFWHVFPCYFD